MLELARCWTLGHTPSGGVPRDPVHRGHLPALGAVRRGRSRSVLAYAAGAFSLDAAHNQEDP